MKAPVSLIFSRSGARVPSRWRKEVERILITQKQLAARRAEEVEADYVGFQIPDFFVVGYGLDFAERYRNLPFVGVLHPHVYKKVSQSVALAPRKPVHRKSRR